MYKKLLFLIGYLLPVVVAAQTTRLPAYPLVTHDPYFSIWSFSDTLYADATRHWTGVPHGLIGILRVDGKAYRFLGKPAPVFIPVLPEATDAADAWRYTEKQPGEGTDFWHINLNVEPWSDRRLSPFFGIGVGGFKNIPNASLVSATVTDANLANAAIGLRYYIGERFVARLDYSIYTAFISDASSAEYKAVSVGLAFFF